MRARIITAIFWIVSGIGGAAFAQSDSQTDAAALTTRLPLAFIENRGQWPSPARFIARGGGLTARLECGGFSFGLRSNGKPETRDAVLRLAFCDASKKIAINGETRLPGRYNFFIGSDPGRWRSSVRAYRSVRYRSVWGGIDVRVREGDGRIVEYDLLLRPGADLDRAVLRADGAESIRLDANGAVVFETAAGAVRMKPPVSWEEDADGGRHPVDCTYRLLGDDRIGFHSPRRDAELAMVIDPGIVVSTFLGGSGADVAYDVVVDAIGDITVAGETYSFDFPTTPGAYRRTNNGFSNSDLFVTRLTPGADRLIFSTFIGGSAWEGVQAAIALGANRGVTIAGVTSSANFPTTPGAYDRVMGGATDAFVVSLAPDGSRLVYSTFLGGRGVEGGWIDVAITSSGAAVVAGETLSPDFPTTPGAYDPFFNGGGPFRGGDAYVTWLAANGSALAYSTFLGGSSADRIHALELDPSGAATVVGYTRSTDFPTTPGAFARTLAGIGDVFVARLAPALGLGFSTLIGGSGEDGAGWELSVALDASGAITVAGETSSADFPTTAGAYDQTYNGGGSDAFITRLTPTGSALVYSTFLGGSGGDGYSFAVGVDAAGAATVAGSTFSTDFPTTAGALDPTPTLFVYDAFVSRLTPNGDRLVYSTYLGGFGHTETTGLALDVRGEVTLTGQTTATDFPTTPGAYDRTHRGGSHDAFITRLDMFPTGVTPYGGATPGCAGPLAIGVTSLPAVGNGAFSVTCAGAPARAGGVLGVATNGLTVPVFVRGATIWIDPAANLVVLPATSTRAGGAEVRIPIPALPALAGRRAFVQFAWPDPCAPGGVSATFALDLTIAR